MKKRWMGVLLALASAAVSMSAQAAKGDLLFKLKNKTSAALTEFYASPPGTEDWEEDILGQDVLEPGESVKITIGDRREDCRYDLKGVFEDGEAVEQRKVDLCDTEVYEFTE
ncbi:hypothetical protein [Hydrocarboniphaga sp.]|uniref:hypothetical protein n=1 Tax=Hydrocarboniphaga sp. TaxID=2033016 RepID=UPI003D0EF0F2